MQSENYCKINSETIILYDWNEIFQEVVPEQFFNAFSESQTKTCNAIFGKLFPETNILCNCTQISKNNSKNKIDALQSFLAGV